MAVSRQVDQHGRHEHSPRGPAAASACQGRASPTPIGELKMVYRHADGLAERGHEVTVAHPRHPVRHPDGPRPRTVTPSTPEGADPHPWCRLRLNDVVCVCVSEVRVPGDPGQPGPDLAIDVAELIWEPIAD